MSRTLWSLNALANELGIDRRTLAKRLQDLPPSRTKASGGRVEQSWHLTDVLAHLNVNEGGDGRPVNYLRGYAEMSIQHFVWWLTEEWAQTWSGLLSTETKLDSDDIRRLFKLQYGLLIHYTSEYLKQDVFNQVHTEQTGFSLDRLVSQHEGRAIKSAPPVAPQVQIPEVIKGLMSEAERAALAQEIDR